MYRKLVIINFLALLLLAVSCKPHIRKPNQIKRPLYEIYFSKANLYLDRFTLSKDSQQLFLAERYMDSASVNAVAKRKLLPERIGVFILRRKFTAGYAFVQKTDSLQFERPYQKKMYLNFFLSFILNEKKEYLQRNKCLEATVGGIAAYCKKYPQDNEAVADLFSMKMYCEPLDKVWNEIENMKKNYPGRKDLLNSLQHSVELARAKQSTIQPKKTYATAPEKSADHL
jgi:hypothetical protein